VRTGCPLIYTYFKFVDSDHTSLSTQISHAVHVISQCEDGQEARSERSEAGVAERRNQARAARWVRLGSCERSTSCWSRA
jgi:hypothetical protein